MVRIKNALLRQSREGKPFVSLELNGDVELVQSQETGRYYATVKKCNISSTFDLETAKSFIGQTLPGKIVRIACDPYNYTIAQTGEVITLAYSYVYRPDEIPLEPTTVSNSVSHYESIAD